MFVAGGIIEGTLATDLLTERLAGNGTFTTGGLSGGSDFILGRMMAALSVDIDLLIGGDGDRGFRDLSSARRGPFVTASLSVNFEGNRDRLCLPVEQLLT